jgi:Family of unknown function (DUF6152)
MKGKATLTIIFAILVSAVTVSAHHSVAALYDANKSIKIEGKIISFSFRSPHSLLVVEAPDLQGTLQRWDVAWNAARELAGQNITRESLKAGDKVVITGNPGRRPEDHIVRMVTFLRPSDGLTWGNRAGETFR